MSPLPLGWVRAEGEFSVIRSYALAVCLLLGIALAFLAAPPPSPRPADTPADAFSAERAMADVRAVARAPHPIGSVENRRVRDHVVARLKSLGLEVSVQRARAVEARGGNLAGAWVENVIGVLPGQDRSRPAVAVMSHYDSVAGSPGAADDAAGVASSLEAIRALQAKGRPLRDVVVLVTDGEETGLFGARAFWGQHPLARRIGAVVNLEARGSSGPAFMFETGPGNGETIRRFAAAVDRPDANSLMSWVYDRMPNGSDFTLPKEAGVQGINIAFIGRPFDYHSPSATPANLDRRSLQHMGGQTLAMLDGLARAETLPAKAPNLVYSDLLGRVLIVYPAWAGWLLLALAAGLAGWALWRERVKLRPLALARGAGVFFLLLAGVAVLLRLAYRIAPVGPEFYQSATVAQFDRFFLGMALLGGGAALALFIDARRGGRRWAVAGALLAAGAACSLFGGFDALGLGLGVVAATLAAWLVGRTTPAAAVWGGLLLVGVVLALVMQALAPATAFFMAWPLLVAAGLAAAGGLTLQRRGGLVAGVLAGAFAVAWLGRFAVFLFDGLGLTSPELLGLFAAMLALVLAPLAAGFAELRWSRGVAAVLGLAGLAVLVFVGFGARPSPRTPAPVSILHVTDAATGRSRLVSARPELDAWSRMALSAGGQPRARADQALFLQRAWSAPTAPVLARPAAVTVAAGGRARVVSIAGGGARELHLSLESSAPFTVALSGEAVKGGEGKPVRVRLYAPGIETLRLAGAGPVKVRYLALHDGWPAAAAPLPALPPSVMPWRNHGSTVTTGEVVLP